MTIVVLLILAGITLTYIMGDNSVFKLAKEAKDKTQGAIQKEQEDIGNLVNMLKEESWGGIGSGDKTEYTDSNGDKAPILGGFYVVKESEGNPDDKNTVRDGLVISDVEGDDLDNSKHGNQFVWIPVPDYSKFHLIEGYSSGNLQKYLSKASNPSREAGDATTDGSPGKPNAANSVAGTEESIAMYKSVKDNGGFYIARFEAGIAGTTANDSLSTKTATDGTVKPLSQKGVGVWNYIPWGGTRTDTATDDLPGNDKANGAVVVARNMYKNDGVHKVTSTLCYGVQWDAALNFIDSKYESGTATGFVKESSGMGNYSKSIATTGSKNSYQQRHIYDMGGNVYEWTMEACYSNSRMVRGGNFNLPGNEYPASARVSTDPGVLGWLSGLRVALYL